MKANIVGVAVNEADEKEYPSFEMTSPQEVSQSWTGTRRVAWADGRLDEETSFSRRYQSSAWEEAEQVFTLSPALDDGVQKIESAKAVGLSKQIGTMFEAELVSGPETIIEMMEVFDPIGKNLVGLRKYFVDHVLNKVEVLSLKPE